VGCREFLRTVRRKALIPVLERLDVVESRVGQLSETVDASCRRSDAMVAQYGRMLASLTDSVTENPKVANDNLVVCQVSGRALQFLWVVGRNANDPISAAALKGIVEIDEDLKRLFEKPGVFLDIGANIGAFSLSYAADGWKGYAIEASSTNASLLNLSILLNGFDIVLYNTAIYDKTGKLHFVQSGPFGYVTSDFAPKGFSEELDCICLDDYRSTILKGMTRLDLVKIDIEGSEMPAMKGMKSFLKDFSYPPLYVEMNLHCMLWQSQTSASMFGTMRSVGYRPYKVEHDKIRECDPGDFPEVVCTDYLFVRDVPENLKGRILPCVPQDEESTLSYILSKLDHICTGEELAELCAFVCFNLQDFPRYNALPQVRKHLDRVLEADEVRNDPYLSHAIEWYRLEVQRENDVWPR
jgi:FkbM family methyltransferase